MCVLKAASGRGGCPPTSWCSGGELETFMEHVSWVVERQEACTYIAQKVIRSNELGTHRATA